MHPALQAKLLHVFRMASSLGWAASATFPWMCEFWRRPISRWNDAVQEGTFREDLFYRLNVITIHIPPLRERREEIPLFLEFFLRKYSEFYGKQPPRVHRIRPEPHVGVQLARQHP